ncbi:hypothetical protein AVEN_179175-1 [Araneus ventricosus]|uniref:CWH43-like N-terminal domain-containing protein n=1 Tax=Araneus ventricosus TaxID=182803 RepID=A0A4Y2C7G1_ARAVE|nr:hypothetical protein AVEN_179175-1 [Araneus ventricosus]
MIARNLLPPFLPLVSDAGGYPPCSGIFAIFLLLASFFSLFAFPILYETVNHRNVHNWRSLKLANKIAFIVIGISYLGLIITACNPIGYTDLPNKFEWVNVYNPAALWSDICRFTESLLYDFFTSNMFSLTIRNYVTAKMV